MTGDDLCYAVEFNIFGQTLPSLALIKGNDHMALLK